MKLRLYAPLCLLLASLALATDGAPVDPLERGRDLTRRFFDGDLDAVASAFDDEMSAAIGGEEGLRAFREQVAAQLGEEVEVVDERVEEAGAFTVYRRTARFASAGAPVLVEWAFDAEGAVAGFQVRPAAPVEPAASRFLDYETRTPLRLPFTGEWTVVWGGRTVEENYHAVSTDQRFAYDLLVVRDGSTHAGDGAENADYHCFGLPVLAPGPGTVVAAVDGVPDNEPGEMNEAAPLGNHVVIDHGEGEFSFLAHLQAGSVRVAAGDAVESGRVVGACGNSGRSSEPHLHYHLQDTPEFGRGEGLPAQFLDYVADGEAVERGEPVQGQRVRPGDAGER